MSAIPVIQRMVAIFWPSFLTAGIATIFFTTVFDPAVIFADYDISRLGSYTISFFLFWIFGAATSAATCYYLKPCETVNKARSAQNSDSDNA
jgi:hypothetical protein